MRVLAQGHAGQDVKALQRALNERNAERWGHLPLIVDGIYGPLTRRAVVALQDKAGLEPDGQAGSATFAELGLREKPEPGLLDDPELDPPSLPEPSRKQLTHWSVGFWPWFCLGCVVILGWLGFG